MTSGQGGEPESHGGTPEGVGAPQQQPGWGQPPAAPPYGPPPGQDYGPGAGQGYAPAPPPPAYGGYAPAPPAGWGAPPAPVERPVTVRAGLGALIGSLVLYLVAQVVTVANFDTLLANARAQAANANTQNLPFDEKSFLSTIMKISIGFGVVVALVYLLFIWFAWTGRQWARIVIWILSGLFLLFGLAGSVISAGSGISSPIPFVTALGWFELVFLAAGIILLALKQSNEWFRYRKWQQMTGQG